MKPLVLSNQAAQRSAIEASMPMLEAEIVGDEATGANVLNNGIFDAGAPTHITINRRQVTVPEIKQRHANLKAQIDVSVYRKLSAQHKLILDLPIIMCNLGWVYGAYFQLHWLEGSGAPLEVPFKWVQGYERARDALEEMNDQVAGAAFGSGIDYQRITGKIDWSSSNRRNLYNLDLPGVNESYERIASVLWSQRGEINPFELGDLSLNSSTPKNNFVNAISVGSKFGDLDDLGAAFGKFSLRYYYTGFFQQLDKGNSDYIYYRLDINKIMFRFADEFEFNGDQINLIVWKSDNLGYWNPDLQTVAEPSRLVGFKNEIRLGNKDFRDIASLNISAGQYTLGRNFLASTGGIVVSKPIKNVRFAIG